MMLGRLRVGFALALAVAAGGGGRVGAQGLDDEARGRAIDGVLRVLNERYIDPEVARAMERAVRERADRGEYNALDGEALARRLTGDLREVCHDLHVGVRYSPEVLPPDPEDAPAPPPEAIEAMRAPMARENFGLAKVEVLPGNIGYLDFRYFAPLELAAETYVGAMACVAHTDALILDLRRNRGSSSPDTLPFLCGYFFARPVHLDTIYWRPHDTTQQFWSAAHVPGARYADRPIYVLTSGRTFSGAESLAYNLQSLGRATVVGATTGGGANPGGTRRADDHFEVWVPFGRTTNAVTGTNWEGVGVAPDLAVPARFALREAHEAALKHLISVADEPARRALLEEALNALGRERPTLRTVTFRLDGLPEARRVSVAGSFNDWTPGADLLERRGDAWAAEVPLEPGRHTYKFVVDDRWMVDPANPETEGEGDFVNSVRVVE